MNLMHTKKMLYGLPHIKIPKYLYEEDCVAKKTMKLFKHSLPMKSKQKLEIIHSSVRGPFKLKPMGCKTYFITFIYEIDKYMGIYLVENKTKLYFKFQEIQAASNKIS